MVYICIIHNLSWPAGHSINDSIPKDLFSCTYDTLDTANSGLQVHVYICTPIPVTPHLAVCLIVCGFP